MSLLASLIWHQMPFNKSNILEKALALRNSSCLSFLDLCSLCINPRSKTHSAIIEHVHDSGTIGWLTDDVVDSYIARTTELCNSLQSSIKFGCTECMTIVQVLQGKKFKNISKSFADILTEPCGSLRDHVFMPVLWKHHFLLLWYCKKNNEVILYDSTSPVDTYLVSSVEKFLLSLLSNFCSSPPALKVDHMVEQKDSSSCGGCVCYTADAIASNILEVHHSDFHAGDCRMWILFALVQHSKRCHMLINTFLQNKHYAEC